MIKNYILIHSINDLEILQNLLQTPEIYNHLGKGLSIQKSSVQALHIILNYYKTVLTL